MVSSFARYFCTRSQELFLFSSVLRNSQKAVPPTVDSNAGSTNQPTDSHLLEQVVADLEPVLVDQISEDRLLPKMQKPDGEVSQ